MPDQHEPIGRRARPADLGPVTETLALAFADDPLWSWAFDGVDEIRACWLPCVRSAIPHGWVWTTPGHEAATLWLPPGCPELSPEDDAAFEPALRALMGDRATLPLDAFAALDARHPAAPPHYYLSLFGTHPAHRGQGLGMRLLRENCARLDAAGAAAYLESTNDGNLDRYASAGFERRPAFTVPHGGPTVTPMWREPR